MVWNWSWDIKGNCSFKLIPFRNKLHKTWPARYISVSVWMQRDGSCNWNPDTFVRMCILRESLYINALQENRMNWTAREMELSRERVELSHMVSATAGRACQGWAHPECRQKETVPRKPVRSAHRAVGKNLLSDWHLCWSEATLDVASGPHRAD